MILEKLKDERDFYQKMAGRLGSASEKIHYLDEIIDHIELIEEKLRLAVEGLEFYKRTDNWRKQQQKAWTITSKHDVQIKPGARFGGKIATETLNRINSI